MLGQFKSGKSSFLNALLGKPLLPVGVLPVTAVITRVSGGQEEIAVVTFQDGSTQRIALDKLTEYVAEAKNPNNQKNVDFVDVMTPSHLESSFRLIDTPGLGSALSHNTETTRSWIPNVAVALVTISADRPLSEEDRTLIAQLQRETGRVEIVLTKIDLLSEADRTLMLSYLRQHLGPDLLVHCFSTKVDVSEWVRLLKERLVTTLGADPQAERRTAIKKKLHNLAIVYRQYLTIAFHAAKQSKDSRHQLHLSLINESVSLSVIQGELQLVHTKQCASTRTLFEDLFLPQRARLERSMKNALVQEFHSWQGNLAEQAQQYENWMHQRLMLELSTLSEQAVQTAQQHLQRTQQRYWRIMDAFRDRLNRDIHEAVGITLSTPPWSVDTPTLHAISILLNQTFRTQWQLIWWLFPMKLMGGMFRRHLVRKIPWEIEKNLVRLASSWTEITNQAITQLYKQAYTWVSNELKAIEKMLAQVPDNMPVLVADLVELDTLNSSTPISERR